MNIINTVLICEVCVKKEEWKYSIAWRSRGSQIRPCEVCGGFNGTNEFYFTFPDFCLFTRNETLLV